MQMPIILHEGAYTEKDLESLRKTQKIDHNEDIYELQLGEVFEILNPSLKNSPDFEKEKEKYVQKRLKINPGNWVYFPWSKILLHTVTQEEHIKLTTNRNRNLITQEEQKKLQNSTISVAGLSIGNNTAKNLIYGGICGFMKIADFDVLDTTNLNRISASVTEIGKPKIEITAQQLYEINPYINLTLFDKGINKDNVESFVESDIVFEAIDSFEMKIRVRLIAREKGVPVVMFTNLGDSILVDIERYDLDPKLQIFNGLIGDLPEKILEKKKVTKEEEQKIAVGIVGIENIPQRAVESVMEVGKTLAGRPQLMSTVAVSSGFAAYIARMILLGEKIKSGRTIFKFGDVINKI